MDEFSDNMKIKLIRITLYECIILQRNETKMEMRVDSFSTICFLQYAHLKFQHYKYIVTRSVHCFKCDRVSSLVRSNVQSIWMRETIDWKPNGCRQSIEYATTAENQQPICVSASVANSPAIAVCARVRKDCSWFLLTRAAYLF